MRYGYARVRTAKQDHAELASAYEVGEATIWRAPASPAGGLTFGARRGPLYALPSLHEGN